ncbi:nuclear transport factor 2 family protein [Alcanivorax sp. 24]|uniref:nuclear transport factor 2 family protein n=1 Tax=Alcanivorax sp. 24 TaxID=2545266 RepID=UPI001F108DE4|nr:nuclear transport factor 2 family protein [Alcanivorax sp. 24]
MKRLFWSMATVSLLAAAGCAHSPDSPGYSHLYEHALEQQRGVTPVPAGALERFIALYSPIDAHYLRAHLDEVYAERIYFNDTLATFYQRDELKAHMLKTAERLNEMRLRIRKIWRDDDDVFLQWIMETRFTVLGRERGSRTIGISQLRFNRQGQVIFHQDFWDSSQGLDQHLPIIGPVTRMLRQHP